MSGHTLAHSTRTVEMIQLIEMNEQLSAFDPLHGDGVLLTADFLGLTGASVHPQVVDRAAAHLLPRAERRQETPSLPAAAALRSVLAAGAPSFPYLYGVFGEPDGGRRQLPVVVHTEHLQLISTALQLRGHRWGI